MEALMSLEGRIITEDSDRSRALLNKFFEQNGYTVISQPAYQEHQDQQDQQDQHHEQQHQSIQKQQ